MLLIEKIYLGGGWRQHLELIYVAVPGLTFQQVHSELVCLFIEAQRTTFGCHCSNAAILALKAFAGKRRQRQHAFFLRWE